MMTKKHCSDAFAAIHETMGALHGVGTIDVQTMHEFDTNGLMPVQAMPPERIRALREREHP